MASKSDATTPSLHSPSSSKKRVREEGGGGSKQWNFSVDYNDHFETPSIAYEDILPALDSLAAAIHKSRSELIIYDPYWCQGNMIEHLRRLGFSQVININRDFYADIKHKRIPEYDVLVTNPPYSGEHKTKLLSYLAASNKPFALLLPAYTASKSYWKQYITEAGTVIRKSSLPVSSLQSSHKSKFELYVMPPDSYEYLHPEGTGKDRPPFYSAWFIGGLNEALCRCVRDSFLQQSVHKDISVDQKFAKTNQKLSAPQSTDGKKSKQANELGAVKSKLNRRKCVILDSVEEMVKLGYIVEKRPNPRTRKKMKLKKKGDSN